MILEEQPYYACWLEYMHDSLVGQIGAEKIQEYITKMANYFAIFNDKTANTEKVFKLRVAEISSQKIGEKDISAAKVEQLSEATEEYFAYRNAKMNRENIQQFLDALVGARFGAAKEKSNFSQVN